MGVHRVRTAGIAAELDVGEGSAKCMCGGVAYFDVRLDGGLRWVEQVSHDTIMFNFLDAAGLLVQTSVRSDNCLSVMDDIMQNCTPVPAAGRKRRGR
ncbi:MAG: hypothetical protein OXK17_05140 [Thaumarchaeota archaeon]|nr:hypothetical protein [Nitrososphaerota archaeon]